MTKALLVAGLAVAAAGVGLSAQAPRPTFDVASIKKLDKNPAVPAFPPPVIRGGTFTLLATNVRSSGRWSARLYFARDSNRRADQASDPNLVSFSSALQEQLGLKLEATRVPVDVLVIDAVRQPTEN